MATKLQKLIISFKRKEIERAVLKLRDEQQQFFKRLYGTNYRTGIKYDDQSLRGIIHKIEYDRLDLAMNQIYNTLHPFKDVDQ